MQGTFLLIKAIIKVDYFLIFLKKEWAIQNRGEKKISLNPQYKTLLCLQ